MFQPEFKVGDLVCYIADLNKRNIGIIYGIVKQRNPYSFYDGNLRYIVKWANGEGLIDYPESVLVNAGLDNDRT